MNYSINFTLQNELIFLQKISYTDEGHKNANYMYFETDQNMGIRVAKMTVKMIVETLRRNEIFIDFHQFEKSFLNNYKRRFFILKLDWKYEVSFNTSLLLDLIDKSQKVRDDYYENADRANQQLLFDLQTQTW